MVREISMAPEVQQIILYGSLAREDARPNSDIDMAIVAPNLDYKQLWRWNTIALEDAPTLLCWDIVLMHLLPAEMQERIRLEGITLYDRATAAA